MVRIKLDQETFGLSSIIERQTKARVKDVFKEDDTIYVIVASGEIGKVIGKGGITIKKLQERFGKKIRAIEFAGSVEKFVANVIAPIKVEEIVIEGEEVHIKDSQKKTKSLLIGRDGKNLKLINRAVKRFYNVEVKVIK
jgi:transcription termination/antitermination protein NusA